MADIKTKPKMDKPKEKSKASNLPKDARRMLINEYKQAANQRGGTETPPEQEAVTKVENSVLSAKDYGITALKNSRRTKAKAVHTENAVNTSAQQHSETRSEKTGLSFANNDVPTRHPNSGNSDIAAIKQDARRNAVRDKLKKQHGIKNYSSAQKHEHANSAGKPIANNSAKQNYSTSFSSKTKSPNTHNTSTTPKSKPYFQPHSRYRLVSRKSQPLAHSKKAIKDTKKNMRKAEAVKKAAAKAAKGFKRVAVAIAKAAKAVTKAIVSILATGGPVMLIFIIIAAIATVVGSPLGVFYLGEDEDGIAAMQHTICVAAYEYHQNIFDIISANPHDEMRFEYINHGYSRIDNLIDIIAVYAISTADFDNGMEVVTFDEARSARLTSIFWDMQDVSFEVRNEPYYDPETEKDIDYFVLYVRAECTGARTMADRYGFSQEQREVLEEMLNGDYDEYFANMIGSASLFVSVGDGGGVVGNGDFIWPSAASTYVTSPFGTRKHPITGITETHLGIDIGAGAGTGVLAADSGTVVSNSVHSSYGIHLLIDHGNGFKTLYAHMSSTNVGAGADVEQGQVIGLAGSTGVSTNPHLHFEVWINGSRVNPLSYFGNYSSS